MVSTAVLPAAPSRQTRHGSRHHYHAAMLNGGTILNWSLDPLEALRRWPTDRPVQMLHSGRLDERWSRYCILTGPGEAYRFGRDHSQWIGGNDPEIAWTDRPFHDLRELLADRDPLWIGHLSYDLGRFVEQLPATAADDRDFPIVQMHRCPGWLVYDRLDKTWHGCGTWTTPPLDLPQMPPNRAGFEAGALGANMTRAEYERRVACVIDYIHAGDVFEVNLSQRFTAAFAGNPRALFAALQSVSPSWYGAYLELTEHRAIASMSPELFLKVEGGRVTTRPIKGTRPAAVDAEVLRGSAKDTAELNMVVDMMRNDLGRVCSYGSIRVDAPRDIESHPTVHHGVATVTGTLHPSKDLVDLLRATMPGGSITGAPKVRAMQIIEELEPARRGPYCGAIGFVRGDHAQFNIAIRTALIERDAAGRGRLDFSVGGGIVADSTPEDEYQETLDKAAALFEATVQSKPV